MRDKMNVKKHQFRNPRVIFSAPKQSAETERALSTLLRRKGNYALAERRKGRSYNAEKKCLKEAKRNRSVQSGVRGVHYNLWRLQVDPSGYRRTPEKPRRGESGSPRAEGTPERRREASGVCGRTPKQSGVCLHSCRRGFRAGRL